MIKAFISFYGLQGSFKWACRQMQNGKTLYRFRDSGTLKLSYDKGKRKIKAMMCWDGVESEWGLSMEDVYATDFKILY